MLRIVFRSAISSYPKPLNTNLRIANAAHCLPPGYLTLPKAFSTQLFDLCWALFILVSLHKRACDAALNE